METSKKFPGIAILFGVLAMATSAILVFEVPKPVNNVFAVFWLVTGLLAFYAAKKH